MTGSILRAILASGIASAALAPSAAAQGGPPPEVRAAIQAIERVLTATEDASIRSFIADRVAVEFRDRVGVDSLATRIRAMRDAVGGRIDDVVVERTDDGMRLDISGARDVSIDFVLDAAGRITRLGLTMRAAGREPPGATALDSVWAGLSWETLDAAMRRAERAGFNGVFTATRNGAEVVRGAYGVADKASGRRMEPTTVFGIGSTPIDFTVTGILLLGQRGKLALDDSIGRYLTGVPVGKRGITLRHLMKGESGLPDFHGVPAEDWDLDLAWIDRATAVRRIMAQSLLFTPGSGNEHSHSAFGLLAVVIEVVSGKSYQQFVRDEILNPLGMSRTGFYGESLGLSVADFAVGCGASSVGVPNIPPNWGPTSWLVMGSGGMFSTLGDMAAYYAAIDGGRLLTGEWAKWQQGAGASAGGSDRGFFIFRATNGRGSHALVLMNGEGRAPAVRAFTKSLMQLVEAR